MGVKLKNPPITHIGDGSRDKRDFFFTDKVNRVSCQEVFVKFYLKVGNGRGIFVPRQASR